MVGGNLKEMHMGWDSLCSQVLMPSFVTAVSIDRDKRCVGVCVWGGGGGGGGSGEKEVCVSVCASVRV